ncbi:hypothetical protein [Helicobacter cetorum]|uniref:Peptidase S6 domain-containing protein n=1 Tax=Helicobacter cetorum (strain ATCC BAA-540 / CCUG 52418 / MIT 99-5656) TaxID=1163745 RepID=I0ESR6_HELCM|nr:hypothetical protein [Helicobacter cetorum]AFI05985.1 hypothetical protein HCD_04915 [Helicobacter cetorum MIT 99-5656]
MDFGQNLGKFDLTSKDFTYKGKHDTTTDFSGMSDFSSRNVAGNVISLGRNITTTAHHIRCENF